jgi:hypothetical protein
MSYKEIELDRIRPSGFNPRKIFDGKKFNEMVASIRAKGVLQPIVVRPIDDGTAFESCKKSQLIEIILKSGIDLAGKVPAEILEVGK